MTIGIENNTDPGEVLEFARGFREASFFHLPAWSRTLRGAFDRFEPFWITAREGGKLTGLMPAVRIRRGPCFSLMSLPFGTYGTPLAAQMEVRRALIRRFMDEATSRRCYRAAASLFGIGTDCGALPSRHVREEECRIITLEGSFDDYRSGVMSKKRRQICNGCEKGGIVVRPLSSSEETREFYRIYRDSAVGWGGIHPYPEALFTGLFDERGDEVVIWGAFRDGKMLGAHIDLYFGSMAQAWQAGMTSESHELGVATFLVYSAVREAYRRKMKAFNLGSSAGDAGMIFFKESMGGKEHRYPVIDTGKSWLRCFLRK